MPVYAILAFNYSTRQTRSSEEREIAAKNRDTRTNRSPNPANSFCVSIFFLYFFFLYLLSDHQLRGARLDSYRSRIHKIYTPDDDLCVWLKGIKSLWISSQSLGGEKKPRGIGFRYRNCIL